MPVRASWKQGTETCCWHYHAPSSAAIQKVYINGGNLSFRVIKNGVHFQDMRRDALAKSLTCFANVW